MGPRSLLLLLLGFPHLRQQWEGGPGGAAGWRRGLLLLLLLPLPLQPLRLLCRPSLALAEGAAAAAARRRGAGRRERRCFLSRRNGRRIIRKRKTLKKIASSSFLFHLFPLCVPTFVNYLIEQNQSLSFNLKETYHWVLFGFFFVTAAKKQKAKTS